MVLLFFSLALGYTLNYPSIINKDNIKNISDRSNAVSQASFDNLPLNPQNKIICNTRLLNFIDNQDANNLCRLFSKGGKTGTLIFTENIFFVHDKFHHSNNLLSEINPISKTISNEFLLI
jgi:hypothetical protein